MNGDIDDAETNFVKGTGEVTEVLKVKFRSNILKDKLGDVKVTTVRVKVLKR